MKKYAIILMILAIPGISFAWDSGCNGTDPYSSTTGQLCGEKKSDCNVGELFSTLTGRACVQPEETDPEIIACLNKGQEITALQTQKATLFLNFQKELEDIRTRISRYAGNGSTLGSAIMTASRNYRKVQSPLLKTLSTLEAEFKISCN